MTKALFAGSFDPLTYGHLDIIKSVAEIFDEVIIGVAYNQQKKGLIPAEKRVQLIEECVNPLYSNVEVCSYEGLTADFALKHNIKFLVRGLRNSIDFEYEKELCQVNSKLNDNIKTVFLITKPEYSFISSSAAREISVNRGDLKEFVPEAVEKYLKTIY